jgi:hypothetical protein
MKEFVIPLSPELLYDENDETFVVKKRYEIEDNINEIINDVSSRITNDYSDIYKNEVFDKIFSISQ